MRLMEKLKKEFPMLPICLCGILSKLSWKELEVPTAFQAGKHPERIWGV